MDQRDWYFHQPVTEGEMDSVFADVEAADLHGEVDKTQYGIVYGFEATEDGGGPSMNIQIATGAAIDKDGHRIFSGGTVLQDITNDTAGVPTAPSAGNRRWVSIYARFGRDLSDPRVDGLSNPLFFKHAEALNSGDGTGTSSPTGDVQPNVGKFLVIAGAEDLTGNPIPARPSPGISAVLICDVLYTDGDTSFDQSKITSGRADKYALRFLAGLQQNGDYDSAFGTGEMYVLIFEAKGRKVSVDNFNRIYISNAGLVFTNNARWIGETRTWAPESVFPMTKIHLDGEGITIYRFNGSGASLRDGLDLWDSVMTFAANGVSGQRVNLSADGTFYQESTTHALWSLSYYTDASHNAMMTHFQYAIPFSSTPSSVTSAATIGSDSNVAAVNLISLDEYGGRAQLVPVAGPGTFTSASRLIQATF